MPQLTKEQYWEWRTTIAEMETAKYQAIKSELELKLMQKESELMVSKQQLFMRTNIEKSRGIYKAAQNEYSRYKKVLEDSIGCSLSDKIIDDITFEVKDLPKQLNDEASNEAKE